MRAHIVGAVLASIPAAWASGAAAAEPTAAEHLFIEGKALVLEQRFDEACPKLEESFRLDPGIGTALWLGDCYEKSGRRVRALASFQRAASLARARNDDRGAVAERRAAILDERLPHLEIAPPSTPEVTVLRDGLPVERSQLGVAVALEPGVHVVTATAPGAEKWSTRVELPDAPTTLRVAIPVRAPSPAPATTGEALAHGFEPEGPTGKPSRDTGVSPLRVGAVAAGVAGVAGISVGVVYGLGASSVYAASNEGGHCGANNACDAEGKQLRREAFDQATVATIAFGGGALALGTSLVLWLVAPRSPRTEKAGTTTTGLLRSIDVSPGGASFRHTW